MESIPVALYNDPDQISGARFIFKDAEGNICKPSSDNELAFYKSGLHGMHGPLRDCVPRLIKTF